jgi:[acyl-carrier-protein] S-malonyltransferase
MRAAIFPGQGAQFSGMGKALYEERAEARRWFDEANSILGFSITDLMFSGSEDSLRETHIAQPAIFLHSVIAAITEDNFVPDAVAGHSLGEFSALVMNGTLTFADGLRLVRMRAEAMQKACDSEPGTMAAVLGMEDSAVESICSRVSQGIVVAANYNCPGQLVISGSVPAVEEAVTLLKEAGARRAMLLKVGGAFHSPLMQPACDELKAAIETTAFHSPRCPVYQNFTAKASTDPTEIKKYLVAQLTGPVRWTQSVLAMHADGIDTFIEFGPGNVLGGLVKKILPGELKI